MSFIAHGMILLPCDRRADVADHVVVLSSHGNRSPPREGAM